MGFFDSGDFYLMNRRTFLATSLAALTGTIPALPRPSRLIICDGNSITDYTPPYINGNWRPWPYWLAETGHCVVNTAVGATDIAECRQRAPVAVDTLVGLAPETWCVIFEGTNYLNRHPDVQAAYQQHVQYCQERKAAGVDKVFIGTIIDRAPGGLAYTDAQRWEFNDLIRANFASFADGVIDFAAISEMGPDGTWADSRYFWDGIHPTDTGSRLLAETARAALGYVVDLPMVRG